MRWTIIQQADGSWAVVDDAGQVIEGTVSTTREEAVDRLRDLTASALGELQDGQVPMMPDGTAMGRGARFRATYLEGERTSDGRIIDPGATNFNRQPPLPWMLSTETNEGHLGAQLSGVIDTVRREGNTIVLEGNFDAGSEAGQENERLVREGVLTTWSPDIGDASIQMESLEPDGEEDDILGLLLGLGESLMHLTSGTILGGTAVPFPALASARVEALAASLLAGGFPYVRPTGTIELVEEADGTPIVADAAPCVECGQAEAELDEGRALTFLAFEENADHFGSTGGSVSNKAWDGSAGRFSDDQYEFASAACDPGDGTVKQRCFLPHHEPGGAVNRNGVHAAAQRVGSLSGHNPDAVARAKAHLRSHYQKDLQEEPPDSISAAAEGLEDFARHAAMSGEHNHEHPAMGSQGGDAMHAHAHAHDGDASHDHQHEMAAGGLVRSAPHLVGETGSETVMPARSGTVLPVSLELNVDNALEQVARVEAALGRSRLNAGVVMAAGLPDDFSPPAEWFEDPELDAPTPMTVTPEGRVYGHLAQFGVCHTGILDRCVMAPRSRSNYAYFMQGSVRCADGSVQRCGHITVGSGHADLAHDPQKAKAHYDGGPGAFVAAHVAVGEDRHGIWFAGAVDPRLDDFQRWELETQAISGDWRTLGGHLELIAALSVPVPGFPILASGEVVDVGVPRPDLLLERGEVVSIVAAGTLAPRRVALAHEVVRQNGELNALRDRVAALEARLESRTEPLLSSAAERLRSRLRGE